MKLRIQIFVILIIESNKMGTSFDNFKIGFEFCVL
jgi:hypothetical protein